MKELIYGDSQSGKTGKRLEAILQQQGADVKRVTKSGKSSGALLQIAKEYDFAADGFGRVWLFFGGNDGALTVGKTLKVRQLVEYFRDAGAEVVAIGLPPATLITDQTLAKKVWGAKASEPDWFASHTMPSREERNKAYRKEVEALAGEGGPAVWYADVREAPVTGAVKQPSGVVFPSQPDGIHVSDPTATEVAQWLADGGFKTLSQAGGGGSGSGWAKLALGVAAAWAVGRAIS